MSRWLILGLALACLGCGDDDTGRGSVSGPTSGVQVNCPNSNNPGGAPIAGTLPGVAQRRRLAAAPIRGDSIDVKVDCGGNSTVTTTNPVAQRRRNE